MRVSDEDLSEAIELPVGHGLGAVGAPRLHRGRRLECLGKGE